MKAFVFLIFSVLIHCYIFESTLLGNGQDSFSGKLFLRKVKKSEAEETQKPEAPERFRNSKTVEELRLSAPKKLTQVEASKLDFRSGLIHLVQSKAEYPMLAQDIELTGTVVVSIELSKKGEVVSSKIHERADFDLLNEAALKAARSLKTYKPLPKALHPNATFLVPIHFF